MAVEWIAQVILLVVNIKSLPSLKDSRSEYFGSVVKMLLKEPSSHIRELGFDTSFWLPIAASCQCTEPGGQVMTQIIRFPATQLGDLD